MRSSLLLIVAALLSGCAATVQAPAAGDAGQKTQVADTGVSDDVGTPAPATGVPSTLDLFDGAPVGFTDEGFPFQGEPDAPVTISEFSDYLCPFCARHFQTTWPQLREKYILTGQAKYVFRDFPIPSLHPTAPTGHAAAHCVGEQGAALYWSMHEELFANQSQWNQLPDPAEYLALAAERVGADMDAYADCVESGRTQELVQQGMAAADALGFNGTPTFQYTASFTDTAFTLVGALPFEEFGEWIDAMAAGEAPPQEVLVEPEPPELPYWANEEGLRPDPERDGFTMAGDPYKGDPDAPLVVVEFSDFQCPSCARHALETQPAIDAEFVDTGDVMWVFKNFPLPEHPQALAAAAAAECAADQGGFWPMHDLLFENADGWTTEDVDAAIVALADQLDLDMAAFTDCFQSRQAAERVFTDVFDARGVTQQTPTFVFLYGGAGRLHRGARSVDEFRSIIEDAIEAAQASN